MKYKFIFLLLFVLFSSKLYSQKKQYDLYLLIGQSNMAGRGVIEAQDTVLHPRVFTLDKNNKWVPARDPIHFDKKLAGVGLGRTFGIEMANADKNAIIGLIPCAVGGSSIDNWTPGSYFKSTKSYPWDDMEKRLKIALKDGTLKGILWHQGESDSNSKNCNNYESKLKDLIYRVRQLAGNEEIPFVAGEIGRFKQKEIKNNSPEIRPSPAQIVKKSTIKVIKKDGHEAFVRSNGLHHKGDNTHFDSASYRIFGKRYAKAMLRLQHK